LSLFRRLIVALGGGGLEDDDGLEGDDGDDDGLEGDGTARE
jgi:hypothetical protein